MEGNTLSSRYGIFKEYSIQTLLSMTYTKNKGEVVTGTYSGDIYIWYGNALSVSIPGHKVYKDVCLCLWERDLYMLY